MVHIKKDPRKFQPQLWFILLFFLSIWACVYIPRYMIDGYFEIGVNPRDLGITYYFSVEWSEFLQIVCLGPLFGAIYLFLMKFFLLNKIDQTVGRNKYYVFSIEIAILILVAMNCMGHVLHLGFDGVNLIDKTKGEAINSEYLQYYLFIWYMDEWLGHTMVHATYFGYLVVAVIVEFLMNDKKSLALDEFIVVCLVSYFISILDAEIAIKSESAFFLMVLHTIFTICAGLFVLIKKVKLLQHPLLLSMLLSIIPVFLFNLFYVLENGFVSYYPFYSSNIF